MDDRSRLNDLLHELIPFCTPHVLKSLERENFRPRVFSDEIANPLSAIRTLLGSAVTDAEIGKLIHDAIRERLDETARNEERASALLRLRLNADFLGTTFAAWTQIAEGGSVRRFREERVSFVREWASKCLPSHLSPDPEQAAAIASVHEHTLVTARAGSGKTRTVVARAAFLIKHCGVSPEALLLLAFNRDAAAEMSRRLEDLGLQVPHVMTFHALAYAIVRPAERLLKDESGRPELSRESQRAIDDAIRHPDTEAIVKKLMMAHFRADWETLTCKGLTLSSADGLAFRRGLVNESLRGEYVKSFGEKSIANFLFEHGIQYEYERPLSWDGRAYRPDFTIRRPSGDIMVEYFGMEGDPDYDHATEEKRNFFRDHPEKKLIELRRRDIGDGGFGSLGHLAEQLRHYGVDLTRMPEEQLWAQIRERNITRFAKLVTSFVARCRAAAVGVDDLRERVRRHRPIHESERSFLEIACSLYARYCDQIGAAKQEDFSGLMIRAASIVDGGKTTFVRRTGSGDMRRIRFLMIDEYQDFTPLYMRLITAVRRSNDSLQVFAVGDDWQAINGFAGSDLRFFRDFESYFSPSQRCTIASNYRSAPQIVDFGNSIMSGCGPVSKAVSGERGRVILLDVTRLQLSAREREVHRGELLAPAAIRVVANLLPNAERVVTLARRRNVWSYGSGRVSGSLAAARSHWLEFLPADLHERLAADTAHRYKGRESEAVIILDAVNGSFPLIHPFWVFTRVLGDDIVRLLADERRLFYVASTRAKKTLVLLTDGQRMSPFIDALGVAAQPTDWSAFPYVPSESDRWVIRVLNQPGRGISPTFQAKELLKRDQFQFNGDASPRRWERTTPIPTGGLEALVDQLGDSVWVRNGEGIRVQICELDGRSLGIFDVMSGELRPQAAGGS